MFLGPSPLHSLYYDMRNVILSWYSPSFNHTQYQYKFYKNENEYWIFGGVMVTSIYGLVLYHIANMSPLFGQPFPAKTDNPMQILLLELFFRTRLYTPRYNEIWSRIIKRFNRRKHWAALQSITLFLIKWFRAWNKWLLNIFTKFSNREVRIEEYLMK